MTRPRKTLQCTWESNPGSSALKANALTTRPMRRLEYPEKTLNNKLQRMTYTKTPKFKSLPFSAMIHCGLIVLYQAIFDSRGRFFFFLVHHYCLVGCLSMIVWTHAVLGVLYACVLYFSYFHLFSAIEHVSHGKVL